MEYGAIDLHKRESQVRIVTEDGEVLDNRIATTRERFAALFAERTPTRILIEASTEASGWPGTSRPSATRWSSPIPTTRRCTAIALAA